MIHKLLCTDSDTKLHSIILLLIPYARLPYLCTCIITNYYFNHLTITYNLVFCTIEKDLLSVGLYNRQAPLHSCFSYCIFCHLKAHECQVSLFLFFCILEIF